MRTSLLALVLVALVVGALATNARPIARIARAAPAFVNGTCGFDGIDLSSLSTADLVVSDSSGDVANYLRVCGALTSASAAKCLSASPNAAACQVVGVGLPSPYISDIGNYNSSSPPIFSYINPMDPSKGVQYQMTGAEECSVGFDPMFYTATVQFVCGETQPFKVEQVECDITYVVTTPLACSKKFNRIELQ